MLKVFNIRQPHNSKSKMETNTKIRK